MKPQQIHTKSEAMAFTGERYVPEVHGSIELEHFHRYLFASQAVTGKTVLDIASGEGYGSAMLARTAYKVIGVDISQEAILHAQSKYQAENLEFRLGSCSAIPVENSSVDIVVSFETIEHHDEHDAMMEEIKRVLRPGGLFIISSPDRLEYSDKPGYSNPYHVKELCREEFKALLDSYFRNHIIYGQRVVYGSAIFLEESSLTRLKNYEIADNTLTAINGIPCAVYLVAVVSDGELPCLDGGFLERSIHDSDVVQYFHQLVADRDKHIASLTQTVAERDKQLTNFNQTLSERDGQIANLKQAVTERDGRIVRLAQAVTDRDARVIELNRVLTDYNGHIASLTQTVAERDKQLTNFNQTLSERDGQIANLKQAVTERDGRIVELHEAIADRERQIADIKASSSWKATAPLRSIKYVFRGVMRPPTSAGATPLFRRPILTQRSKTAESKHSEIQREIESSAIERIELPQNETESSSEAEFCPEFYLANNPDIAAAGIDPYEHYVKHGKAEGRLGKMPEQLIGRSESLDSEPAVESNNFEFCLEFYLANNPDVAAAGIDPYEHYVKHGKAEGRLGKMPDLIRFGDFESLDDTRETVLIVGHEGSRTGAPILSYNLVRALQEKYNVVALFLGPGPILEACHAAGAVILGAPHRIRLSLNSNFSDLLIKPIAEAVTLKFAIINSIESRGVLMALGKLYIPTITLVHEFAAYVRPLRSFRETVFWSGQTVFSARITRESFCSPAIPELVGREFPIIPQGRCLLPTDIETDIQPGLIDAARLRLLMRPPRFPADGLVILGAGFVHIRKGVDLFIECATRVCEQAPDLPCRFVWIGNGYAPDMDTYSMFLADQISRAGLKGQICFIDEVSDLAAAYEEADIFLLSSRLDPLPNVALDALSEGLPLICFDKTTGIADILQEHGLGETCVAAYLDTQDLARKVLALARSTELRAETGTKSIQLSERTFNMAGYLARLEQLASQEIRRTRQERLDVETIAQSPLFQPDYFNPSDLQPQNRKEIARAYIRSWASSMDLRKPLPGFHPGIYLERHGVSETYANPFADYIRAGQPHGPWSFELITPHEQARALSPQLRIGLHIHAYYPDLFPEVQERLELNRVDLDLLISVANEEARGALAERLKTYERGEVDIRVVPNLGRDIGPFLTEFGPKIRQEYDLIGHLHTKKTHQHDEQIGRQWYRFMLENLLGGQTPMADIILGRMAESEDVGMVFPDDPNVYGWTMNRAQAEAIAAQLGVGPLPEHFAFPLGTMFWANVSALTPLFDLGLKWENYPEEPLPVDGTVLHALERLFSFVVQKSGKKLLMTHVPGVTR